MVAFGFKMIYLCSLTLVEFLAFYSQNPQNLPFTLLGPLHYISSGRGQAVRIVTCQHQTWGKEKRQRQAVLVQLVNDFHNLYRTQLKIT